MKTTFLNFFFLIAFCLLIISVPVFWLTLNGNWLSSSQIENRELEVFPHSLFHDFRVGIYELIKKGDFLESYNLIVDPFVSLSFQNQVDLAVSDQFPLRIGLISLSKSIERFLTKGTYSFVSDPAIPASLTSDYVILKERPFFIQAPAVFDESDKILIDKSILNYQQIIENNPDVNFYVFYYARLAYALFNPMAKFYPNADNGRSFQYFLENKPEKLVVSEMPIKDLEDFRIKFFNADHHWNARGAWQGYELIYDMIRINYPDINPKLNLKGFITIPGLKFCGTRARLSLYPCTPDVFEYADVDLPKFRTFVNGEEKPYGKKDEYLAGNFNSEKFVGHYTEFFGPAVAIVKYDFDNQSDRNLLIIGDSFKRAIQGFVASHYRNTYSVDIREYKTFSLGKFISDYQIDDVLILGDVTVWGGDKRWEIPP
jgi:hypothetical protein